MISRSGVARLLNLVLILSACTPALPEVASTQVPGPEGSVPSAVSTSVAMESPTAWSLMLQTRVASTRAPAPQPTPDDRALSPGGPWLVFSDGEALWVTDGRAMREVYRRPSSAYYGIPYAAAPSEGTFAFAGVPMDSTGESPEQELFFVQLPEAAPARVMSLISSDQLRLLPTQYPGDPSEPWSEPWFLTEQIRAAVSRSNSLAWSPDGTELAVVAALDAPNTDLYVHSPRDGTTTRLTDGPYQTAEVLWSPTGKYIAHAATSDINIGRSGPTLIIEGLWSAEPAGGRVVRLAEEATELIQWVGPDTILLSTSAVMPCSVSGLTSVNLSTGKTTTLWPGSYSSAAADPATGTVLVGVDIGDESFAYEDVCPPWEPNGLYLLKPDSEPFRIGEFKETWGHVQPGVAWSEDAGMFMATTPTGVIMAAPSGELSIALSGLENVPLSSPSGTYMAVEGRDTGLAILTPDGTVRLETSWSVCEAVWLPDSSALYFTDGDALYLASAPDFAAQEIFRSDDWSLCEEPLVLVNR